MRWRAARVVLGLVMGAAACSAFDEGDGPADAGAPADAAPAPAPAADAGAEAGADRCSSARDPGLACGAAVCKANERCCDPLGDARCVPGSCPTTQLNCASADDCSAGQRCCRTGNLVGSTCRDSCVDAGPNAGGGTEVLCARREHCDPGMACLPPPDGTKPWWFCQPCAP